MLRIFYSEISIINGKFDLQKYSRLQDVQVTFVGQKLGPSPL